MAPVWASSRWLGMPPDPVRTGGIRAVRSNDRAMVPNRGRGSMTGPAASWQRSALAEPLDGAEPVSARTDSGIRVRATLGVPVRGLWLLP